MARSNFEPEIRDSLKSLPKDNPHPNHKRSQPPGKATSHNPDTVAKTPPASHQFSDTTAQDGLEAPSPVGTGSLTQADTLPMNGATLPDSSAPVDLGGIQDPMLADAVQMIIQALMARASPMPGVVA